MVKKEIEQKQLFIVDDIRAILVAWVASAKNGDTHPNGYLTKEGMAYLNGFLQSNNTADLIRTEQLEDLQKEYAELIGKYETSLKNIEELQKKQKTFWQRWKFW